MFFLGALDSMGQCTPDNGITKPGFYPNQLPEAVVNTAYSEVIQFKIVKDTTVIVFGSPQQATIDSAIVLGVTGMPPGINFQLNKASKKYTPAETGCALVSGTPSQAGTYKLKIILHLFAKISGFPVNQVDTVKNFSVVVKSSAGLKPEYATNLSIYPNPLLGNKLTLAGEAGKPGMVLKIYNSAGQCLETLAPESDGTIAFEYPAGVYFLELNSGSTLVRARVLKQ